MRAFLKTDNIMLHKQLITQTIVNAIYVLHMENSSKNSVLCHV